MGCSTRNENRERPARPSVRAATATFASVVVTHDVRGAFRVADKIALLSGAKIRAVGTSEEILQSKDPAVQQFLERDLEMAIIHSDNESGDGSHV